MKDLQTASWDNTNIYLNLKDPTIESDFKILENNTKTLQSKSELFTQLIGQIEKNDFNELYKQMELAKELTRLTLDSDVIFYKISIYASTCTSVNALDYDAKALLDRVMKLSTEYSKAIQPMHICINKSPVDFFSAFLDDPRTRELTYQLTKERKELDHLLNVNEEVLLTGFKQDGISAWGKLYKDISGSMKVNIDGKIMGLATANNYYSHKDRTMREKAYRGIKEAWVQNEISACAILNSINGWRNEEYKVRSTKKPLHYLDKSCLKNSITRETLDTLMTVTYDKKALRQEVLTLMARELNVDKLGPWDLMAPPQITSSEKTSYPEAIAIIKEAFNEVNPEMGDFAQMMMDKKWIDCADSENRSQGAYCTGFENVREPRVFMTFDGSMKNVITLAHEIGHAYHSWVMRDIPSAETHYGMSLAETASIFAETTVRDYLLRTSKSKDDLKLILWQEIESAQSLLINIPSRFEFEKRFVDLRMQKNVTVPETKELMIASQRHWYGDALSECDEMFWASKLHFSISELSFYNFPYLFGYLFSMGIYAKKDSLGAGFHVLYVDLLRDTGRMSAEELVMKHFNEDISQKEFWLRSIKIVEDSVQKYKNL